MVPVCADALNWQLTKELETVVVELEVVVRTLNASIPTEEPVQPNTRSLLISIEKVPLGREGEVTANGVGATTLSANGGTSLPAAANVTVSPPAKMSLSLGTAGTAPYCMVPASYSRENVGAVPPTAMVPALRTAPVGGV